MYQRNRSWLLGAALLTTTLTTLLAASPVQAQETRFRVVVENISPLNIVPTPTGRGPVAYGAGFFALSNSGASLFNVGQPAGRFGLENLAEDGVSRALAMGIRKQKGFRSWGEFRFLADNLLVTRPPVPGDTTYFEFTARPGDRLVFAYMFGNSNDTFFSTAPNGISLFTGITPIATTTGVDITEELSLYDAGTEVNEPYGLGPNQGGTPRWNFGPTENGVVRLATNLLTGATALSDGSLLPQVNRVTRVTVFVVTPQSCNPITRKDLPCVLPFLELFLPPRCWSVPLHPPPRPNCTVSHPFLP